MLIMQTAQPLTDSDHANLHNRDEFPDWDYMPGEGGDPFECKASDSPARRYRLPMTYCHNRSLFSAMSVIVTP